MSSVSADVKNLAAVPDATSRYVLWVLMLTCALNFLDRQVVNILAEPIKKEFGLSDTELGLLTGFAFAAFHATLSIPVARLADRTNRSYLIAGSMAVWSLATVASGFVSSFGQLLAARMTVGLGEAGGIAPAHALIADYTPKVRRASAIAFYSIGIPLGGLFGMAIGGLVMDAYGWRTAFIVAGVPGLILAPLLAMTIRDPKRSRSQSAEPEAAMPAREAFREMASKKAFLLVTAAGALMMLVSFSHAAFMASFFFRVHGPELNNIASSISGSLGTTFGAAALLGLALGLSRGLTGIAGTLIGGHVTDRIDGRGYRAYATIPAYVTLVRIPILIAGLLVGDAILAFMLLAFQWLLSGAGSIGGFAAVQGLVRPQVRATAAAVYALGINLVGLGIGPLLVGLLSDTLAAGGLGTAEGLRWALISCTGLLVVAATFNWMARDLITQESVS